MARTFPRSPAHELGASSQPGDWQALRGELVTLLDQVETQYVRSSTPEPGLDRLARRVQELRDKVADPQDEVRHEAALRSVRRAVDRFSDREEAPEPVRHRNPRDTLQSAIEEIRSGGSGREPEREERNADDRLMREAESRLRQETERREQVERGRDSERRAEAERLERFVGAMGGINTRLEHLEGELKAQAGRNGAVNAIGEQVSQLAGVVETLASAVGETGQVKRLEAQIGALSRTMESGPKVDLSTLTRRIGDLAQTVERLADMQAQQLTREKASGPQTAALHDGMRAVEASVRTVYDRIDAMERTYQLSAGELERLTEEMAAFTRAMRENEHEPRTLIARVDALHARIDELDGRNGVLNELREDVASLRGAVVSTFEPRFSALEDQLEELNTRVSAHRPSDASIETIREQMLQLVRRVDDTGEQLASLLRHHANEEPREEPDFEAIAAMVARKTSEAVARSQTREPALDMDALASLVARKTSEAVASHGPKETQPDFEELASMVASRTSEAVVRAAPRPNPELSEKGLDALEARMSRMFASAKGDGGQEDLTGMQDGIRRVDERLERLEAALERANQTRMPLSAALEMAAPRPAIPAPTAASEPMRGRMPDAMRANPAEDVPLRDPGYGPMGSVREALAGSGSPISSSPIPPVRKPEAPPPRLDLASAERPPRPVSSLGAATTPSYADPEPPRKAEALEVTPTASRNTFIEAARRAAQKQTPSKPEAGNSLIGRALARFQAAPEGGAQGEVAGATPNTAAARPPVEAPAPQKPKRGSKGKAKPQAASPELSPGLSAAPAPGPDSILIEPRGDGEGTKESFLVRHRQPILLAAAMVAVSLMTLNLVGQRMMPAPAAETLVEAGEPAEVGGDAAKISVLEEAAAEGEPAKSTPLLGGPRISPVMAAVGADPMPVGSIDPASALGLVGDRAALGLPASAEGKGTDPAPTQASIDPAEVPFEPASPVKVELPPDALGPEMLRQAASEGDARAQFEVAAIYTEGQAVTQDFAAAATWYERAAAQGFAPAQYRLGSLYESGKGVEKDLEQARLWYTRAAEAGNRMSMHNLAALYAGGELGTQDFAAAARWFEEAASRGMTDSQFNLGMLYARGLGVAQNMEASYKWFSLAAARGDADAAKARDDIAKSLDPEAMARVSTEIGVWQAGGIDLAANFAPIGTWSDKFDPGAPITDKEIVTKVQAALARLGYDVGTPDGVMGPKTGEAIKAFERATGMNEIGAINPRLLAVLGSQPV